MARLLAIDVDVDACSFAAHNITLTSIIEIVLIIVSFSNWHIRILFPYPHYYTTFFSILYCYGFAAFYFFFFTQYTAIVRIEPFYPEGTGSIGEILRREGIYSSTLTSWRKERDAAMDGAFSQKRGPEPKRNPLTSENEKLRRRNQRLEDDLRKAELIIEVQKKLAMLLSRPLPPTPDTGNF